MAIMKNVSVAKLKRLLHPTGQQRNEGRRPLVFRGGHVRIFSHPDLRLLHCSIRYVSIERLACQYWGNYYCTATGGSLEAVQGIIKKYGNRRLYDTSTSQYINLDEIASPGPKWNRGAGGRRQNRRGLTRVTLTQIIVENAKEQPAGLPLELLRQLVMASDHVGQEFIMWYLKSAFDTYQKLQTAIQGGFSEVQSAALSPLSMMKRLVQGKAAPGQPEDANLSNSAAWQSWSPVEKERSLPKERKTAS